MYADAVRVPAPRPSPDEDYASMLPESIDFGVWSYDWFPELDDGAITQFFVNTSWRLRWLLRLMHWKEDEREQLKKLLSFWEVDSTTTLDSSDIDWYVHNVMILKWNNYERIVLGFAIMNRHVHGVFSNAPNRFDEVKANFAYGNRVGWNEYGMLLPRPRRPFRFLPFRAALPRPAPYCRK